MTDPNVRFPPQVNVAHADSIELTFSTLMGEIVEPQRNLIQTNALNVADLVV